MDIKLKIHSFYVSLRAGIQVSTSGWSIRTVLERFPIAVSESRVERCFSAASTPLLMKACILLRMQWDASLNLGGGAALTRT